MLLFDSDKMRADIFVKKNTLWKRLIENIIHLEERFFQIARSDNGLRAKFSSLRFVIYFAATF